MPFCGKCIILYIDKMKKEKKKVKKTEYQVILGKSENILYFNTFKKAKKFFEKEPTAIELRRVRWHRLQVPDGTKIAEEYRRDSDETLMVKL